MQITNLIFLSFFFLISGLLGICIFRTHLINVLINLELLILAVNLNFVFISIFFGDIQGQVIALLILSVAAAESALGLALVICYYRLKGGISIDLINLLKS
jgi:NADH-quinone oxidoreductase subunit K